MQTIEALEQEFRQNTDRIAIEQIDGYRLTHSRQVV